GYAASRAPDTSGRPECAAVELAAALAWPIGERAYLELAAQPEGPQHLPDRDEGGVRHDGLRLGGGSRGPRQQVLHRVAGLRALLDPLVRTLHLDLQGGWIRERVVVPEHLD